MKDIETTGIIFPQAILSPENKGKSLLSPKYKGRGHKTRHHMTARQLLQLQFQSERLQYKTPAKYLYHFTHSTAKNA